MPAFPRHLRLSLAAFAAAAVLSAAVARAEDVPWLTRPEPMGARAQNLVEQAGKNPSAEASAQLVQDAMRLPPGQCVSVLEALLSRESVSALPKEAVLTLLAQDPDCPLSRRLADAVLRQVPRGEWDRQDRQVRWQRSLRRLNTPEVISVLAAWSRDGALPFGQRVAALRALGSLPALASLEVLLAARDGGGFGAEANDALRELFCLPAPPSEAQLAEWRGLVRHHDPVAFNLYLKDRMESALRDSRSEIERMAARLVKQEEALFQGEAAREQAASDLAAKAVQTKDPAAKELAAQAQAAKEEVSQHLVKMLGDPELAKVRLKALDLVEGQIEVGHDLAPQVRTAMRACIAYGASPEVRAKSVHLLSALHDPESAALVADRLASGAEDQAEVLSAMMLLMKRDPRKSALPAVRALLGHPAVGPSCAEALAAYDDRKMIDDALRRELAESLKAQLAKAPDPEASFVLLLGQVLGPADSDGWGMVGGWLDNPRLSQSAREAAALALAKSTRPLLPLLRYVDDADPQSARLAEIALRAVGERGCTPADAQPLLVRVPAPGAARDLWSDALLGWAGRAPPKDVGDGVRAAVKGGAPASQAVRMLEKALARPKGVSPQERAALEAQLKELAPPAPPPAPTPAPTPTPAPAPASTPAPPVPPAAPEPPKAP